MMKSSSFLTLILITLFFSIGFKQVVVANSVVFGYLPEWRYHALSFESISEHVTHIIFFSLEMDPKTGMITAMDRLPNVETLQRAKRAKNKAKLYICFGGNGRSDGFKLVLNKNKRQVFITQLISLMNQYEFDGVDYNWEYPGYSFQHGYSNDQVVNNDYKGLYNLVKETREAFDKLSKKSKNGKKRLGITLAYYPDGRQEKLFLKYKIDQYVDYMHMMTYDQHGNQHSSYEFAIKSVEQAIDIGLPSKKLTLGLPFYGRDHTGHWTTYEDILSKHYDKIKGNNKEMNVDKVLDIGFNSVVTIEEKTKYAIKKRIGGVMIWEIGQDCRIKEVKEKNGNVHIETCKGNAPANSLHFAISRGRGKEEKIKEEEL